MERHEADEQLRRAIIDHARAYETADPESGELLDQVIVVTAWMMPDDGDDPRTSYSVQMLGGRMQHHTALGMCHVAINVMTEQANEDD